VPSFDDSALQRLRELLARTPAVSIDAPEYRRACVLVPFVKQGETWKILFSRRSEALTAHKGQIAFPGGGVEAGESLSDAAIREAEEEVGIPAERVELIGRLDDVVTNSGFLVAPFVGVINGPIDYILQETEVSEVFEVPVEALLRPDKPEVRYVPFRNRRYPAYFYPYEGHEIWGLTGRMLKAMLDLVWRSV
jgi:8-oxo-dGTP pyrophosphatase MutT (NUDIX family)